MSIQFILYQDMDGCLCDFVGLSRSLFGEDFDSSRSKVPVERKIEVVQQTPGFWSRMPWMSDGRQLWNYVQQHRPRILSAYALWDYHNCLVGKREWIGHNLSIPADHIHLVNRSEKATFARSLKPNTVHVLIDDFAKNIAEWRSAGGHGIHHTSAPSTIAALKQLGL
jgi:hypothetical protein